MKMAEQQGVETNADFLPEQEELIQSATETIGNEYVYADLEVSIIRLKFLWIRLKFIVTFLSIISFYSFAL